VTGILIGVLSNYIYAHTLGKKEPVAVQVDGDEMIITQGNDRIIVPRVVHEATQAVAKNPVFVRSVDRMLGSVIIDEHVTGFGLTSDPNGPPPALLLPRDLLAIRDAPADPEAKTRVIEEECYLYIVKAIMERSKRKWEFKWHGVNIAAPIKDPNFYNDFASHNFTIAPGDVGGGGRRGQNGRTTRTTLPQVDGSGNAASVGGTVGDLTIRGLMTAWDGHGLVFLSVKRSGQVFDSCRFRPCGAGIF
jgi:hypothetical protein